MKTLLSFIMALSFYTSAYANIESLQGHSEEQFSSSDETITSSNSELVEKSFSFLVKNLDKMKLSGPGAKKESLQNFRDNLQAYVSNLFGGLSFTQDDQEEEPTNIEKIETYKCDLSGKCQLKLKLKNNEHRIYTFHVVLISNIPVAIKNNILHVN
jgi:hypothetical protein